jgi:hypothetical protein
MNRNLIDGGGGGSISVPFVVELGVEQAVKHLALLVVLLLSTTLRLPPCALISSRREEKMGDRALAKDASGGVKASEREERKRKKERDGWPLVLERGGGSGEARKSKKSM